MSERKQGQEFVHEGRGLVDQLTQPQSLAALRERHQTTVEAFADKDAVEAKEKELMASLKALGSRDDIDWDGDEVRNVKDELRALDYGMKRGAETARANLYLMDRRPGDYYDTTASPESQALQRTLERAIEPVEFMPAEQFKRLYDEGEPRVWLSGASDEALLIPAANIISAEGFDSWSGRGHQTKDGNADSEQVITRYAALPAESAPGIVVNGVEREDGAIVYVVADGAHRVAAARERGDMFVKARDIIIHKLRTE